MKTMYLITFLFLLFFSCKKYDGATSAYSQSINKEVVTQRSEGLDNPCDKILTSIVKSSTASAVKSFEDLQVRGTEISSEKITIELYVKTDVSENPSVKKISDRTVGWLIYFPGTAELKDITEDTENPLTLSFDKKIVSKHDVRKYCNLFESDINKNQINPTEQVNCYRAKNEPYSFIDVCEFDQSKDLNYLHNQISKKFDQDDLLKTLPKKDTTYSTTSTPKIAYIISKGVVKIAVNSEGGESEYKIYHKNNKAIIEAHKVID